MGQSEGWAQMVRGAHVTRRQALVAILAAAGAVATGCTAGSSQVAGSTGKLATTGPTGPVPKITISPLNTTVDVPPTLPVQVSTDIGALVVVTVTDATGASISGALAADGSSWASTAPLAYASSYVVAVTASADNGQTAESQSSFTTVTPTTLVFPAIGPLDGTTVGVGLPVRVYFDSPVTNKAAVEKTLAVTATPAQIGSWSWLSTTEVHWRPQAYWAAGSQVTVDVAIFGVDLGGGAWGKVDRQISFSVGEKHVSVADSTTHQMQVFTNDVLVNTIPVALGKEEPGRYTKSGAHIVIDKNRNKTMDSTTYGLALDAGGYVSEVEFATRISNNGEFVHSAPWSVADQGVRNVSHGCINASPANAEWFFDFSQIGDVVEVVGTPVTLGPADGDIFDWAIPWEQWVAGSAATG